MNTLLSARRELRDTHDPKLRSRENHIHKIMVSYGYDRDNAVKVYEISKVRAAESILGTVAGAVAVYKFQPIHREWAKSYKIFRKPWMRFPAPLLVFTAAYNVMTMLPSRAGRKLSFAPQVDSNTYTSSDDLVGRFRLFEKDE